MNARAVSILQKSSEAVLLLLAFGLPVAVHWHLFHVAFFKDLTLQAAGAALLALTAWRFLELGRVELPASRAPLAMLCGAWLAWLGVSFALNPLRHASLSGALHLGCCALVFLLAMTEAASCSFAAALADWTLAAAAVVFALYESSLLPRGLQPLSTLGHPDLLSAFFGMAFPLGLARASDRESPAWRRGAAFLIALLCPLGMLPSGSPAGLWTLCLGAGIFSALSMAFSRDPVQRGLGLVAAAAAPACVWAAFLIGGDDFWQRILQNWHYARATSDAALRLFKDRPWLGMGTGSFVPAAYPWAPSDAPYRYLSSYAPSLSLRIAAESGLIGLAFLSALLGAALLLSLRELSRKLQDEPREGALMAGLWAAAAALLGADCVFPVLNFPAPGVLFWLFSGCLAGMALEKGSARVWILPIPLPPAGRRAAAILIVPLLAYALSWPSDLFRSEISFNRGVFSWPRGAQTVADLDRVSSWHPHAWVARQLAAESLLNERAPADLRGALERYAQVQALLPRSSADCGIGDVHRKSSRWGDAAESYKRCLQIRPDAAYAYAELADVSAILHRKDDVLAAARAWIRADPQNPDAWRLLADQYRERKKFRVARRMLNKAERISDVAGISRSNPSD